VSLFDRMREAMFEQRFWLDPANRQHLARIAQEHGAGEAEIQAILSGRILPGQSFGGAHVDDLARFARRLLFVQGDQAVTLRVSRPPFDEAGHIEIKILDVQPPEADGA
jgi:hypothetical protein